MLPRLTVVVGAGLAALTCACSSTLPPTAPILPLRTLRLYETGVGYFERSGALTSSDVTSLPVPAGHIDDALKTLVVLDRNGKSTVHGVEFGSSISRGMARALAGLPTEGDAPLGFEQLVLGLRGSGVEVRTRAMVYRGRLVDLVTVTDPDAPKDKPKPDPVLLVLTEHGEIVRIPSLDTS